jgi:radical SAM superfamily enzyme YgiQ (UPF0313 family)
VKVALVIPESPSTHINHFFHKIIFAYRNTLPILAAYTPKNVELVCIDENVEKLDINYLDNNFDIVGLSVITSAAPRAYEIARKLTIDTVLGGPHITAMPDEAKEYGVIAIGRGEEIWPQILSDKEKGRLQKVYIGKDDIKDRFLPDRSVLEGKSIITIPTIQTTEGCPNQCDLCSIHLVFDKYTKYPIDEVIKDIESTNQKYIAFLDDNIFADKSYAIALFQRLAPLKRKWFSQAPIEIVKDEKIIRLMANSGCIGLYLGIDSIMSKNLINIHKKTANIWEYIPYFNNLHNYGIHIEEGFIFGFDTDKKDVFEKTLEFAHESHANAIIPHILTPYPGTRLWENLKSEGRLFWQLYPNIYPEYWGCHTTDKVTYLPKGMTPSQLQEGYQQFKRNVYSLNNIIYMTKGSRNPMKTLISNSVRGIENRLRN